MFSLYRNQCLDFLRKRLCDHFFHCFPLKLISNTLPFFNNYRVSWGVKTLNLTEDTCPSCPNLRELVTLEALIVVPANRRAQSSWRLHCSLLNPLSGSQVCLLVLHQDDYEGFIILCGCKCFLQL